MILACLGAIFLTILKEMQKSSISYLIVHLGSHMCIYIYIYTLENDIQ